jgi:hypothetical protein
MGTLVEHRVPVLIVGGGAGGVAAALACAGEGVRCLVAEPLEWVGGQLTTQAVPPDENRWVEGDGAQGCTRRYAEMRERVRAWYRQNRSLRPEVAADPRLNPGGGWVSRLCAEPRVFHAVLRQMLEPGIAAGLIDVRTGWRLASTAADGDFIRRVSFVDVAGIRHVVLSELILEATETGDLLAIAGVEHAIGAEATTVHGELHGRADLPRGVDTDPLGQQACSWCFAMEHRPGEDHTIPRPAAYDAWRVYVPEMSPAWTGRLFDWTVPSHNEAGRRTFRLVPWPDQPEPNEWEMWRYRRIVDRAAYLADAQPAHPDVCLVNWVQMDYWRRPLLGVSEAEADAAKLAAKEQSACLLYWMQTEAPRHDGGAGYPGLRLRGDELGSTDGFALAPYIREPRRLAAKLVLSERHLGTEQRRRDGCSGMDATEFGVGEAFEDSVAIGHYPIDLHPSCAGRNNVYVPATPYRVPMRALVPRRVRNLLAAGKCLGVSHIANGTTRMHCSEWSIGEAAGAMAAWCVREGVEPADACARAEHTRAIQSRLRDAGMPLAWPWETPIGA